MDVGSIQKVVGANFLRGTLVNKNRQHFKLQRGTVQEEQCELLRYTCTAAPLELNSPDIFKRTFLC